MAAAAIQSAVYVMALRQALAERGFSPEAVSGETILVCPQDFSNRPVRARLDVRKQLTVLRRQLARIARIDDLLDVLPPGLTFDLDPGDHGIPRRRPADLGAAIRQVDAQYTPDCLSTCEMCFFCRDEARGCTAALGRVSTAVTSPSMSAAVIHASRALAGYTYVLIVVSSYGRPVLGLLVICKWSANSVSCRVRGGSSGRLWSAVFPGAGRDDGFPLGTASGLFSGRRAGAGRCDGSWWRS